MSPFPENCLQKMTRLYHARQKYGSDVLYSSMKEGGFHDCLSLVSGDTSETSVAWTDSD